MLSWCAGLIEFLHHRSEGIFFFSNWSDAFTLGIKHRQQILLNFSIFIFIILFSLFCHLFVSFSCIRWIFLSLVLLWQKNDEKSSHSCNKKPFTYVQLPYPWCRAHQLLKFKCSKQLAFRSFLELAISLEESWYCMSWATTRILRLEWSSSQYWVL